MTDSLASPSLLRPCTEIAVVPEGVKDAYLARECRGSLSESLGPRGWGVAAVADGAGVVGGASSPGLPRVLHADNARCAVKACEMGCLVDRKSVSVEACGLSC